MSFDPATDVIFQTGFEQNTLGQVSAGDGTLDPWNNVQRQENVEVVIVSPTSTEYYGPARSGSKACKLGSKSGGGGQPRAQLNWWDGESMRLTEVYVSFWVFLPDPGYRNSSWEMMFDQHDEDWNSLRKVHIRPDSPFVMVSTANPDKRANKSLPMNRWVHVQQFYALRGIHRVWQDDMEGDPVIDRSGVDMNNGGSSSTIAKINVKFYSSPSNPRPSWKYIDDYVISRTKVPSSYRVNGGPPPPQTGRFIVEATKPIPFDMNLA